MKAKTLLACSLLVGILATLGTGFVGGSAPNELVVKPEEPVVPPVAFATFDTSLYTEEQSDTFALSRDAQHGETSVVSLFAILAPADARIALFANSGADTADPDESSVNLIQNTAATTPLELSLLEGHAATGARTETVT